MKYPVGAAPASVVNGMISYYLNAITNFKREGLGLWDWHWDGELEAGKRGLERAIKRH